MILDDCPGGSIVVHGPDELTGPPCCHGITPECNGYPSEGSCGDHNCCPDPCRHMVYNGVTCPGPCCHHVPRAFCATFTPDYGEETDFCFGTGYRSTDAQHHSTGTDWDFLLPGVGRVTVSAVQIPGLGCAWRLSSEDDPYLETIVQMDHFGENGCREPPVFRIENASYPVVCDTCTGTYEITPFTGSTKIPFGNRFDYTTPRTAEVECGACNEVPYILCMRRRNPGTPTDLRDTWVRQEFTWDENAIEPKRWISGSDIINLIEYEGACYLQPFISGLSWLEDEDIPLDPEHCAVGFRLRVDRYGTDEWVEFLGTSCSMFSHLCGRCRCICNDVCMVGMQDGAMVESTPLVWNGGGWSGDGGAISLEADESGNCQVRFGDWEPVGISNLCGDRLVFLLNDPYNPRNWRYVYCVDCAPCGRGGGDCRSVCPDFPNILYADFEFVFWEVALCGPAEGPAPTEPPCVSPFTIPMQLVRAAPEASFDWFWIGQLNVDSCRSCDGAVSDEFDSDVTIILTCNGELTIGGNSWSVTLPCGCEGGEWNIEVLTDPLSGGIGGGFFGGMGGPCCQNAQVRVTITR